jgi:hypothetical protein
MGMARDSDAVKTPGPAVEADEPIIGDAVRSYRVGI